MKKDIIIFFALIIAVVSGGYLVYEALNTEDEMYYDNNETYIITFKIDNEEYKAIKINKNTKKLDSVPADPEKDGYTFLYWEYDGEEFDFNNDVDKNITLIAKFQKNEERVIKKEFELENSSVVLKVGATSNIKVKKITNDKVKSYKSSNTKVATVTNNGVVKAVGKGSAYITVLTEGGLKATYEVVVTTETPKNVDVTSISLNKQKETIYVGNTLSLTANINPTNATNKSIKWTSSDNSIATVTNGLVKGIKEGSVTITATSNNGKTATCVVTVSKSKTTSSEIKVESITLNNTNVTVNEGSAALLMAKVSPENATNKTITWTSSNTSVATVTNGLIRGIKEGTTTITAKSSNGVVATSKVKVEKVQGEVVVTSVTLNPTSLNIKVGETSSITSAISPASATNKTITWSSSNPSVATVSGGIVKGIKEGSATITATSSNGKTATCNVTVTKTQTTVNVSSIILGKTSLEIKVGDSSTLTTTISPSNATDKTITWTSSNTSVATVNNGVVTGKSVGTATITAKSNNGKTATCTVTVKEVAVTGVSLDKTSASIKVGETTTVVASISPSNAADKTVTWTSDKPSVATVSGGVITGKSAGSATITATSSNGKTATCTVTVKESSCTSKIHFMNTGSSDAFIIESCGHYGLVDSSNPGNGNNAVQHVVNYIKKITGCSGSSCKGVLEFVIATHSHSDHIGGMPTIAETFVNSKTTYYYRTYVKTKEDTTTNWNNKSYYTKAVDAMKSAGAKLKEVTDNNLSFKFYDYTIKLLNTQAVSADELDGGVAARENYNSIIQLITHKNGKKVLLAADLETPDEARVKGSIGKIDVLKAGHHAYNTSASQAFLDTLKPSNVIVSNTYIADDFKICYALTANSKAKIYVTISATDAIVLTFTDTSFNIKKDDGGTVPKYSSCEKGWVKKSCWYYYPSYGKYVTGWNKLSWSQGTNWFYFKSDGCMLANTTQTIDGKSYHFNANGVCDSAGCDN